MAKPRMWLMALVMALLLSLPGAAFPASPLSAAPDEARWTRVNIPAEGGAGNWVLAPGSDVKHLTMAIDGTLYGYASPSGTSYTLFKSTDNGDSWSPAAGVTDAMIDIAVAPDDASIVYYATVARVYRSLDAAVSFIPLPPNPGGAGSGNITITSIDIVRAAGSSIVAVGTADAVNAQYGGVYLLDESQVSPAWTDSGAGAYDVRAVAFSPNFAGDRQLVAVVSDEQDTVITSRIGDIGWGIIIGDAVIEGLVPLSATIAFPDDYSATAEGHTLFVAISSGSDSGDVYRVRGSRAAESSMVTDLDVGASDSRNGIDISSLAISGTAAPASLLAGASNSTHVYASADGGDTWTRSSKEPRLKSGL